MNKNEKVSLRCEIVKDLLPLYHDKTVSDVTADAVKEHLFSCESCQKEYSQLNADISPEAVSTKEAFNNMMAKKRRKQIAFSCLLCLITAVVIIGGYFALTELHLKPLEDINIECVYRYNNGQDDKFFISYSTKTLSGSSPGLRRAEEDGRTVYIFERKIPIISKTDEFSNHEIECFEISDDCDALYFGRKEIWSREKNADDTVPPFVYAYEDFETGNDDELGQGVTFSYSDGKYSVYYGEEKREITWDLEGNLIYDSQAQKEE